MIDYVQRAKGGVFDIIRNYTSSLALHIIAGRFYGMRMSWDDHEDAKSIPAGHQIHFDKAIFWTINRLATLFMTPKPLLSLLPGQNFKEASVGFAEMTKYINELRTTASQDLNGLSGKRNKTMLESIVLSAAETNSNSKNSLDDESVMGNIFFSMLAGHETTGGTLGFSLLILAIYPEYQKQIQEELDSHFQSRPGDNWSYERDFKTLQKGIIGAIQKEVLVLYEPSQFVLRRALEAVDIVDGKGQWHHIPKGTLFVMNKAAHNSHPDKLRMRSGVTPAQLSTLLWSPALYFNPERWLGQDDKPEQSGNDAGLPYFQAFGDGNRACPGRGFAQAEMTAVMATIFKGYNLELVVDEETLQKHQGDAQRAWEAVRDKAIKMLYEDVEANITLGVSKELPIRIVPRL